MKKQNEKMQKKLSLKKLQLMKINNLKIIKGGQTDNTGGTSFKTQDTW
ncbi:hypothetical protein [Chryseobacterium fistulae]|uniref:Uncharacterized protein n=1 Tax=Chryseobacterium fistulae TaxID=2675058 RepID=A0A6N4XW73_9FLAO|nr:hypothetical protein [Chryseobacterium fistulae]CAA7392482.1 hypothetical protein CHRY9393_03202 [Chryseobacterium fistulae]